MPPIPTPREVGDAVVKLLASASKIMPGPVYRNFLENLRDHVENLIDESLEND